MKLYIHCCCMTASTVRYGSASVTQQDFFQGIYIYTYVHDQAGKRQDVPRNSRPEITERTPDALATKTPLCLKRRVESAGYRHNTTWSYTARARHASIQARPTAAPTHVYKSNASQSVARVGAAVLRAKRKAVTWIECRAGRETGCMTGTVRECVGGSTT